MEVIGESMVNGVPLVLVVLGLVEWIKRFGVSGKVLNVVSMAIGALVGVAYWYAQNPLQSFSDWFGAIIYGLALGLVASGIYDAVRSAVTRS